mmetsp:Transcript_15222/g.41083  ORF Transcript_15222/g.41083 Transcript_15222/m.41083 type:complete len:307 (-) Transcript_15222:774-1694(-)
MPSSLRDWVDLARYAAARAGGCLTTATAPSREGAEDRRLPGTLTSESSARASEGVPWSKMLKKTSRNPATSEWVKSVRSMACISRSTLLRSPWRPSARIKCKPRGSEMADWSSGLPRSCAATPMARASRRASSRVSRTSFRRSAVPTEAPKLASTPSRPFISMTHCSLAPFAWKSALMCFTSWTEKPACRRLCSAKSLLQRCATVKKSSKVNCSGLPNSRATASSAEAWRSHPKASNTSGNTAACNSGSPLPPGLRAWAEKSSRVTSISISRCNLMSLLNSLLQSPPLQLASTALINSCTVSRLVE